MKNKITIIYMAIALLAITVISSGMLGIKVIGSGVPVRSSDTPGIHDPKIQIHIDKLGCTWIVASTGRFDGGVAIEHHPTCRNPQHQKL